MRAAKSISRLVIYTDSPEPWPLVESVTCWSINDKRLRNSLFKSNILFVFYFSFDYMHMYTSPSKIIKSIVSAIDIIYGHICMGLKIIIKGIIFGRYKVDGTCN